MIFEHNEKIIESELNEYIGYNIINHIKNPEYFNKLFSYLKSFCQYNNSNEIRSISVNYEK